MNDNYHMNLRPGFSDDQPQVVSIHKPSITFSGQYESRTCKSGVAWPTRARKINLARKYSGWNTYTGRVENHEIQVTGRTRREAVKRLRVEFSRMGMPTRPDVYTDLLVVKN